MGSIPSIMWQCRYYNSCHTVSHPFPRFANQDLFMHYHGGGVGHLATWQCNQTLLADEHTVLAIELEAEPKPAAIELKAEPEPAAIEDSESKDLDRADSNVNDSED